MDKALVVAISTYGGLIADPLPGAANALISWSTLLVDHYGFVAAAGGNLHSLPDDAATKENILAELQWLGAGATASDRLIVIFIGHGSHLDRLDPDFRVMVDEQCLITYPRPFDSFEATALYGDEITNAISTTPGRVLLVIDACHSRGVFDGVLKPLYIEASEQRLELRLEQRLNNFSDSIRRVTFKQRLVSPSATFARDTAISHEELAKPPLPSIVVVSAAQELESAYEDEIDGKRQMLFSYYATDALNVNDTDEYQSFLSAISAKLYPNQTPDLDGDSSRHSNPFTY